MIDGQERCVIWRHGQLVGDAAWIERAERAEPGIADRDPVEIVRILEETAGSPTSLLISDEVADDALRGGELAS